MLNAKLVIVGGGDAKVSEIQLKLPTTIGRSSEAKVKLPHPLVSRKHCELFERDGQLIVRDLGSLNGTYIDSNKIEREQPLGPNQLLTLGTVTFRAIYEMVVVADAPVPSKNGDVDLSERPTQKAPSKPKTISEVETEKNDVAANDTDTNLPTPSEIDFSEIGVSKPEAPAVASSIFDTSGKPTDVSSNVLSDVQQLSGAHAKACDLGGIIPGETANKKPSYSRASFPNSTAEDGQIHQTKSSKRRPR